MTVCVHGLGNIGLMTAALFANNGREVVGYDTDAAVRQRLRRNDPNISEPELQTYVERALEDGLTVKDSPVPAAIQVICVPTPYDHTDDTADLTYVIQAGRAIRHRLREGDLVVLESTVPPGTTTETLGPLLADSGLEPGSDFGLAYVPETVMPGNTIEELRSNDRILGGIDRSSTRDARSLYESVSGGTIHIAPDAKTAEFTKLIQNSFRDVNIAFANMTALVAADYGIDVWTAIELANNHRRVDILRPGPGVGGHCLPVDPLFLGEQSEDTELVETARTVNDGMPEYVVSRLEQDLGSLTGLKIAVLGIAYKGNVDDTRNSPGLAIANHLRKRETEMLAGTDGGQGDVEICLADPHVSDPSIDLCSVSEALRGANVAVIAAGHDEFADLSPSHVGDLLAAPIIMDTLGMLSKDRWESYGFRVIGL